MLNTVPVLYVFLGLDNLQLRILSVNNLFVKHMVGILKKALCSAEISGFTADPSGGFHISSPVRSAPDAFARPFSSPAHSRPHAQDIHPPRPASNPGPSTRLPAVPAPASTVARPPSVAAASSNSSAGHDNMMLAAGINAARLRDEIASGAVPGYLVALGLFRPRNKSFVLSRHLGAKLRLPDV